ncbi:hypothetical protein QBC38DRAFT_517773 [Podospora fimiseda]|uniref:Uncharacterized protein n=1 Tax=Podospora fimiseda TaxID=252190 RepID=A0AAN7BGU1_9PEZI|nr:hypothetical protein QBC38DRAFT_517773 [Podospora fimiseda]
MTDILSTQNRRLTSTFASTANPRSFPSLSFLASDTNTLDPQYLFNSLLAVPAFNSDDGFSPDFFSTFVGVVDDGQGIEMRDGELWGPHCIITIHGNLDPGPYFVIANSIHQAWKLFHDVLDAFSMAVYSRNVNITGPTSSKLIPLTLLDEDGIWKAVTVPSRCYFLPSKDHPLAGMRITVKDNYPLAGVKSTFSSRTYTATYDADIYTAAFVRKLIHLV